MLWQLTRHIITNNQKGIREVLEQLSEEKDEQVINETINYAKTNDTSLLLYETLLELGKENTPLARQLEPHATDTLRRAAYSDQLLMKTIGLLEENNIQYVIFKTFNTIKSIDVDIDLLINPWDYWRTIRLLLKHGYIPIDDIHKTYATGLMIKKNPIILDLHTEITILGIPYITRRTLFKNRTLYTHQSTSGAKLQVYTANKPAEALARIAHGVIKEAEFKLDDLAIIHQTTRTHPRQLEELAIQEALQPAYKTYRQLIETHLNTTSKTNHNPKTTPSLPPYKTSRTKTITTLLHRLTKRGEIHLTLKATRNIWYPRNAAHIGHLLINQLKHTK